LIDRPCGGRPKRLFDVVAGSVALIALSPLAALVACAVRIAIGSPVIYRQRRPGWRGQPFDVLKFRTMTDARASDGRLLPDAQRLTPFGRVLRQTSLDELPELINVVRGEMSLVGPRPLLMAYLERYAPWQARRHEARPGITGLAQVSGRNQLPWDERFALDVWYVDHWSMTLDVKIVATTVWKVLTREGINQEGQATAEEFKGPSGPMPDIARLL